MMKTSLSVFQDHLIDYAGLFPPANLSLENAINNYLNYLNGGDSWMLGPFVLPVSLLKELDLYIHLFSDERPLTLSIVGTRTSSKTECRIQFQKDCKTISTFMNHYGERIKVEMLEILLPPEVPSPDLLEEIANGAANFKVHAFCEVPFTTDWQKHVTNTLDEIASHNGSNELWIGVKLRTGGIKAEMFPSTEKVAFVLASCRDRNLPIKFTAGLHHPVRMYRDEVETKMHGFLNIFMAGMLAYSQNLSIKEIEDILSDENPSSFSVSKKESLGWQDLSVTAKEIKELRKSIVSFGSCSFDEPRDELLELKNQQEVLL
jgi:hypothetical protein